MAVDKGQTYTVVVKPGSDEVVRSGPAGLLYAWVPLGGALLLASVVVAGGLRLPRLAWVLGGAGVRVADGGVRGAADGFRPRRPYPFAYQGAPPLDTRSGLRPQTPFRGSAPATPFGGQPRHPRSSNVPDGLTFARLGLILPRPGLRFHAATG